MSLSSNFPTVGPVLNLDFVNNQALDPRVTFTRASTATYYDAQTSAKAEENLFPWSQQFEQNTVWVPNAATISADVTTAPDGTTTADRITANAGTGTIPRIANTNITVVSSVLYTVSIFAKADTYTFLQIYINSQGTEWVNYTLSGAGTATANGSCTATITSLANSWYRLTMTYTPGATDRRPLFMLAASGTATRAETWNPAGTEAMFLWGAQLEQRSSVTAYTATTTAPITNYIPVLLTAQNNIPRFDFNPVTRVPQGLLIEESRTNLVVRSEEFDNAVWTVNNLTVSANTNVAPNGTLTADQLVMSTGTAGTFIRSNITLSAGSATSSVYLKSNGVQYAQLWWAGVFNATDFANFDLVNGTVTAGTNTAATITAVGNGWYRCTLTSTVSASVGNFVYYAAVPAAASGRNASFTGNGFSGFFIWGSQVEQAAFPTSYIPTVAATVTRSADLANMTGTNFSSWFNASEGTIYSEAELINGAAVVAAGTTNFTVTWISDGGSTNFITQRYNAAASPSLQYAGLVNNVAQWAFLSAGLPLNAFSKNASAYKFNDIAQSVNAGTVGTDTSATLPVVNRLDIGVGNSGAQPLNGHVRKVSYYNYRVSNAQLQALTRS